jgi:hypothetical protein
MGNANDDRRVAEIVDIIAFKTPHERLEDICVMTL